MTYEEWRISFQDSEQAARAAFRAWQAAEQGAVESGEYRDTLEHGIAAICEAIGVSTERYDRDQSDISCYMDCFNDAASWLKEAGVYFDSEEWEIVVPQSTGVSTPDGCFELMASVATALYAAVHAGKLSEADRIKSDDGTVEIAELLDRADAMLATQQPPAQKEESSPVFPVNEESLVRDDPLNTDDCTHSDCGRFYDHNARRMSCRAMSDNACARPGWEKD